MKGTRILKRELLSPNQQYNLSIAEKWIDQLISEDLSPKTIKNYHGNLKIFLTQLNKPVNELSYEDIANFLNSIKHLSNSTREHYICALLSFFTYCVDQGHMSKVLIKKRWRIKQNKLLPRPLDRPQRAEIRILAEQLSDRDRALIEFSLFSGCRANEVSALDICDFDFANKTANVMGKGRKPRIVYYSDTAALLLQKISQDREPNSPMFLNNRGQRLTTRSIHKIVSCAGIQMETVNHNIGPHVLRHTFASHMLSNGADLLVVAQALGHASLQTTRGYAKNLDDDLIIKFHKRMG